MQSLYLPPSIIARERTAVVTLLFTIKPNFERINMKKVFILASVLALTACGGLKLATPTEADVTQAKSTFPEYTLEEMQAGFSLYNQHCSTCHALQDPKHFTEEQWRQIVPNMVNEAINRRGAQISDDDQEAILKYVISVSNAARQ